jgi:GAF domain
VKHVTVDQFTPLYKLTVDKMSPGSKPVGFVHQIVENDDEMRSYGHIVGRALLVAFTLWALAMIVPDFYQVYQPLGSFGFYANNDGIITDVQRPFLKQTDSPAFQAGLRAGERLDLEQMRCIPIRTLRCASAMAALGGFRLVTNQRRTELVLAATPDGPARVVDITAKQRPYNGWVLVVLLLDQLAAMLVILAAAWLVWTRPGIMTWGFFLYVIWFNPGQSDQYYALLQLYSPVALLTQNLVAAIAQGAGLAGFIWFALRAPTDQTTLRWRPIERRLPLVATLLMLLLALSYANLLGYPTEMVTRAGVTSGFGVAAWGFVILLARQRELPPQDYQRLRWVIWGCAIGLPAHVFADVGTTTTLLNFLWSDYSPPQHLWGLLYLINGILCLLVAEAIRKPHVVKVSIPLRRVTILGLLLSLPFFFLHHEIDYILEKVTLPTWTWFGIAAVVLFLISKIHDTTVHYLDWLFNRSVAKTGERLGDAVLKAKSHAEIEAQLVQGVHNALRLASAGVFREQGNIFQRTAHQAWEDATRTLDPNDAMLKAAHTHRPYDVDSEAATRNHLPSGPTRPILAVPVGDQLRCLGLALYGPHATGNALSYDERSMLAELANKAASALMRLNDEQQRRRIATLESELATTAAKLAGVSPRSSIPFRAAIETDG